MNLSTRSRWTVIAIGLLAILLVALSASHSQAQCPGGVCPINLSCPDGQCPLQALPKAAEASVVTARQIAHTVSAPCRPCAHSSNKRCYPRRVLRGCRGLFRRGR